MYIINEDEPSRIKEYNKKINRQQRYSVTSYVCYSNYFRLID